MEGRLEIYQSILSSEKNKIQLAQMEKMSISKLKELQSNLGVEKEKAYAEWFEKEGTEIGQKGNEESNQLADQFRRQMKLFNIRMRLAKFDSHNLANAIGLSKFERKEGARSVKDQINLIKKMLNNISKHKAIKEGLVREEVIKHLMEVQLALQSFEAKSARDAEIRLDKILDETVALETYFPPTPKRKGEEKSSTPWNGKMRHWEYSKSDRNQKEWDVLVKEYDSIYKNLENFYNELKEVKHSPELFSQFNHKFLNGPGLQLIVDRFKNMDGLIKQELVSLVMKKRLDEFATLLNPDEPGSLAHQMRARQASRSTLTQSEVDLFYERFNKQWEQLMIRKEWFDSEQLSSFYYLAKPSYRSLSQATSADE
jgi:hypothetical protein